MQITALKAILALKINIRGCDDNKNTLPLSLKKIICLCQASVLKSLHSNWHFCDILVSYDVSFLFTNVPLDKTIQSLANRAFKNNWFNTTYDLNLTKTDLVDLLSVATKGQLFKFNGPLYEQTDGVAMGPLLIPY